MRAAALVLAASTATAAQLDDLGPNEWRDLGMPAPDPVYGSARGRSWTPKMAAAPDLGGAFLAGSGTHGAVNAEGFFQDDLAFYHLLTHSWQILHPGSHVATLDLTLDERGFEVDATTGMPIPVAAQGHGYNLSTYDSTRRRFAMVKTDNPGWLGVIPQRADWLAPGWSQWSAGDPIHAPWFYDVDASRWTRDLPTANQSWRRHEGVLEYVLGRLLLLRFGRLWWYDLDARTWTMSSADELTVAHGGYDAVACYHATDQRLYVGRINDFAAFDVNAGTWEIISDDVWVGSGNDATLTCDTGSGVVLSRHYDLAHLTLRAYDLATGAWGPLVNGPPNVHGRHSVINAFYDQGSDVHVYHDNRDSLEVGHIVVYRYGAPSAAIPNRPRNLTTP